VYVDDDPTGSSPDFADVIVTVIDEDQELLAASTTSDQVYRYDPATNQGSGAFVTAASGGLDNPQGIAIGADGNLYVSSAATNSVLRYDGRTGDFLNVFVTAGSGGLSSPAGLVFGPDGNLYVSSFASDAILRFNGTTGALIGTPQAAGWMGPRDWRSDRMGTSTSAARCRMKSGVTTRAPAPTWAGSTRWGRSPRSLRPGSLPSAAMAACTWPAR
jgi:streptogramin lyase